MPSRFDFETELPEMKMQAVRVLPTADGGQLEIQDIPIPEPGPGEVRVRVRASGINYGEIKHMREHRAGQPVTAGVEFAGEIDCVGSQVQGWRVGDRVMGHGRGCHAQYVIAAPLALMALPDDVSYIDGAAFPNVFITAHDALVSNGELKAGESVFINGASGGVGMAAIMIASALGAAPVIASSRSAQSWSSWPHSAWMSASMHPARTRSRPSWPPPAGAAWTSSSTPSAAPFSRTTSKAWRSRAAWSIWRGWAGPSTRAWTSTSCG
jgi:hypothetical protein